MTSFQELAGPFLPPKSGKAKQVVMFLHGYGSNGDDLLSIGESWAEALPDAVFVSPNAPDTCDAWPAGYQWFSIRAADGVVTKQGLDRAEIIRKPAAILNAYIDRQLTEWGVDESMLAVAGFSQGAMMAMYTMPRRKNPCAAVIGYSGMIIDAAGLKSSGVVKPPILAIHGGSDDVVPPSSLADVQAGFAAADFNVETVMRPGLGHSIDHFGLMRGVEFIQKAFEK